MGLIILVIVIGAIGGGTATHSRDPFTVERVHSTKHGWITANAHSDKNDFWDTPSDFCNGIRRMAEEVVQAVAEHREADTSAIDALPGHGYLENGIRVRVLGHGAANCGLKGKPVSFTRVQVADHDSNLNAQRGYIIEGLLSKQ